jgi:hypothetical protein
MARQLIRNVRYYFGLLILLGAFLGVLVRLGLSSDLSLSIFQSNHPVVESEPAH